MIFVRKIMTNIIPPFFGYSSICTVISLIIPPLTQVTGITPESSNLSPRTPFARSTVVGTLACAVGGTGPGGAPAMWRVLEFCNAGCLQVRVLYQYSQHCGLTPRCPPSKPQGAYLSCGWGLQILLPSCVICQISL